VNTAIVSPVTNGTKPHRAARSHVIPLPSLVAGVDHLAELRGLIRRAQDEARTLTAEILGFMESAGLAQLEGAEAVAVRETRTNLKVDVALFVETLGARAHDALTVSVTGARRLLGEEDLRAISETVTAPTLRVVAREVLNGGPTIEGAGR
jgi:hypothetical protein